MSKFESLMEPLTPEKDAKVTLFLDELKKIYDPLPQIFQNEINRGTSGNPNTFDNHLRLLAYKYLVSRSWNVKDALKMAVNGMKIRDEWHMDDYAWIPSHFSVRQFDEQDIVKRNEIPPPKREMENIERICNEASKSFFCGYHGYDTRGFPTLYMLLGRADAPELIRKLKLFTPVGHTHDEVLARYVAAMGEAGRELATYQDIRVMDGSLPDVCNPDGHVRAATVVVDLYGLTMKMLWKPALDLLRHMLVFLFDYYPECVTKVYVVNCPRMLPFAYSIVRPMLNEHVQKKIAFFSPSDTAKALDEVIGLEKVPTFLGGKCSCPNGCIMNFNPSGAMTATEEDAGGMGDVVTEEVNLKAGSSHTKTFNVAKDENVTWEFASTTGKDVKFRVYFTPRNKPGGTSVDEVYKPVPEDLVRNDRPTEGADNFVAPADGILRLVWDNAHSWLRSKSLQMRVFRITSDGIEERLPQ